MIKRIRLKNWKSHLDSEFKLSEGVNAFIGIMGSGKSSITQAISFALFGTMPALQSKRIVLDDLIMRKPHRKSGCEVEVEFVVDGKDYSIRRVVEAGHGTTSAEIREGGRVIDETANAVTNVVERVLQMDYELFSRAVYSEQNGLDYFLRMPKGSRMQQIDEMLKVDRFEEARVAAVSLANKVKQKREEKMRLVSDLEKEGLDDKITALEKEIEKFSREMVALQAESDAIRKERETVEKRLDTTESTERELNEVKQELQGVKYGLAEVDHSIESKRKRLGEIGNIEAKIEAMSNLTLTLSKNIESVDSEMIKLRNELASVNTEIKLIADSIRGLGAVKAKCPVCDSDVSEEKKRSLIEAKRAQEKAFRKRVTELASSIEEHDETKSDLQDTLGNNQIELARLKALSCETELITELEAKKGAYIKREQVLSTRVNGLESALAEADVGGLRAKLRDIASRASGVAARLAGLGDRVSDRREILRDLAVRNGMLNRYKSEVKQDAAVMEKLGDFVKALRMTQEQLREEFLKTVNSIMGEIWKELYPYGDFDGVRLAISEGDYILQLRETTGAVGSEEGPWVSVDGIVSGGERSMACLALRIAFSMAFIPNLKWLILDEPTHNLDANAITQFSNILRDEKIGQFVDQVILITHEERVSESIDGSIYRLERDKEVNEPTRAQAI